MRKSKTKVKTADKINNETTASATKPAKSHRSTYVGKRLGTNGTLSHFWLREDEDQVYGWKEQRAPAKIGECWEFFQTDDNRTFLLTSSFPPKRVSEVLDNRSTLWAAEEQADINRHSQALMNKHLASRETEFEEAMKPLHLMLSTLQSFDRKSAFIAQVQNALWKRA